jgi:glycosyltransferase involved in cell wall biosynthesis
MLRFAVITTFYPPYHFGGDGQAVRRLVHALARRGHKVDVLHDVDAFRMLGGGVDPQPLKEPEGITIHPLRSMLGPLSCLLTQQFGRPLVHGQKMRDILRSHFDVIHFHNVSLIGGAGVLAYGNAIKLYTAHEHWLVCPSHVLWRHNRERCDRRECVRCVLRYRRPPQLWRYGSLLKNNAQNVDAFITMSQFCADKHKEFGFERSFSVVGPFLPETETDSENNSETEREAVSRPFFLFVGRLELIKGLQEVIPLFDKTSPADLWIAGSGGYESNLRRLASNRPRVRFLGHRTPAQLRALYRKAIAVVLPSICFEVFPMVVLEAFREGTPIIARRLGPFPEIVEQSNGGLLFDTSEELRGALGRLTTDTELRKVLSSACRKAFHTLWSEGVAMKQYFDLILRLARERGNREIAAELSNLETSSRLT